MLYLIASLALLSPFNFSIPTAHAEEPVFLAQVAPDEAFWDDVSTFVFRCAVQPYAVTPAGHKVRGNLKSVCRELQIFGATAKLEIRGETFVARLYDSEQSDGGDLNDVYITTLAGQPIAYRSNVLSYGDVLLALVDGRDGFREEYESSLLQ